MKLDHMVIISSDEIDRIHQTIGQRLGYRVVSYFEGQRYLLLNPGEAWETLTPKARYYRAVEFEQHYDIVKDRQWTEICNAEEEAWKQVPSWFISLEQALRLVENFDGFTLSIDLSYTDGYQKSFTAIIPKDGQRFQAHTDRPEAAICYVFLAATDPEPVLKEHSSDRSLANPSRHRSG